MVPLIFNHLGRTLRFTTLVGTLLEDVIRLLCSKLVPLQMAACDAVAAFASNDDLNENLFKRGALPILIEYLFEYDYTLEEGGVERDVASNKQEQKNKLSKQVQGTNYFSKPLVYSITSVRL